MARPPLPIGTHGRIRVYKLGPKRYQARTQFRDHDGVIRHVERVGWSQAGAQQVLLAALRDRGKASRSGEITGDMSVRELGELWLAEIERAVGLGKRSPNTLALYRLQFDRHVRDGIGRLRVRELSTGRLDRFVVEVHDRHGTAAAKTVRTVLSGMVGLAVRHDAMDRNPVRDVGRIESNRSSTRALTLPEAIELRGYLHEDEKCQNLDLVDLTDFMLATGLRIGEATAVTWDALDLDAGTVEVRGTVIRIKGQGLSIKWKPKSKSGYRTLELSSWAVTMLRERRSAASNAVGGDPVFPAVMGGLRDPSNTQADLRDIFARAGYGWVTSHVYRKTVATLMDDAGLSARQAADQLGHSKISMTQDFYFGRKPAFRS
ncbi:site-specific integrase [Pseudonocardia parietis]|uniref:Integrase n=1 Tax=Pseudonocardia parietis TaxID=570936 RepID=A0ABS4W125_9PSEU|nr:site-specific integrase [Pseudonocardia parietis]MBP2369731.1 integrase [Pseudonocardia parietis]